MIGVKGAWGVRDAAWGGYQVDFKIDGVDCQVRI